jgi:hypothetical protein
MFLVELLVAALRTELPDDMVFEAIPFHSTHLSSCCPRGLCVTRPKAIVPFLSLSRTGKGQILSLPIPELDFKTAEQDAVLVTTYMPEAEFNVYYKSVPLFRVRQLGRHFTRPGLVR